MTSDERPVTFADAPRADLRIDRVYEGGTSGTMADDVLSKMFPVGNQGGFRYNGSPSKHNVRLIVLYTSGADLDWPDAIDPETGDFTYYGDNKKPGSELHATSRRGNLLLRDIFAWSSSSAEDREKVPPILLFEKYGKGRSVQFRGLLAPGSPRLSPEEELVAVWRTTRKHRFQNYRAHFTILDEGTITREWIDQLLEGEPLKRGCPRAWRRWVQGRIYTPLMAPRTVVIRSKEDQYPTARLMPILKVVHEHFMPAPIAFEHFAADLWVKLDQSVESIDVTRPSRDGGRDAVGTYLIGPSSDPVRISFALEAKCWRPEGNGVGVKEMSRLISRIKHRDFGVFVTTAHIGRQPYEEVREDAHPIVIITGGDIVNILRKMGLDSADSVREHLQSKYPIGVLGSSRSGSVDIAHTRHEVLYEPEAAVDSSDSMSAPSEPSRDGDSNAQAGAIGRYIGTSAEFRGGRIEGEST